MQDALSGPAQLLVVFITMATVHVTHGAGTVEQFCSRAIPFSDTVLSGTPADILLGFSKVRCAIECGRQGCLSFNFGDGQCELFNTFLCDGANSLQSRLNFKHFDVEFGAFVPLADVYRDTADCTTLGRCSPKCFPPTTTPPPTTPTTTTTTPAPTTTTTTPAPTTTTTTPAPTTTTTPAPTTTTTTPAPTTTTTTPAPTTTTTTPAPTTTTTTTTPAPTTTTTTPAPTTTTTPAPTTTTTTPAPTTTTTPAPTTTTTTPAPTTTTTPAPTTTTTTPAPTTTTTTTTPAPTTTTTPAPTTTTTPAPTTTTTTPAPTTTTTTPAPTTTEAAGTTPTGPGSIYYTCASSSDCELVADSECREGVCQCNSGYHFNPAVGDCVQSCDVYGTTFTSSPGWFINGYVIGSLPGTDVSSCETYCWINPDCRSFSLYTLTGLCEVSNVSRFFVAGGYWQSDMFRHYFQRDCE